MNEHSRIDYIHPWKWILCCSFSVRALRLPSLAVCNERENVIHNVTGFTVLSIMSIVAGRKAGKY